MSRPIDRLPALDMHCHVVQAGNVPEGEVPSILSVTFTPDEWLEHRGPATRKNVVWALGLHPWEIREEGELGGFLELLPDCDAVGEIGVDRSSFPTLPFEAQRAVLEAILDHAETRKRIVSLHAWQAYPDLVEILAEHPVPGAVIHWFLGTGETLQRAIEMDVFFSVNDAMFVAPEGAEVIPALPQHRVLTETDAPSIEYGTGRSLDVGERRTRPLRPGELEQTEARLAEVWKIPPAQVRSRLWANLAELESRVERRPFSASRTT